MSNDDDIEMFEYYVDGTWKSDSLSCPMRMRVWGSTEGEAIFAAAKEGLSDITGAQRAPAGNVKKWKFTIQTKGRES